MKSEDGVVENPKGLEIFEKFARRPHGNGDADYFNVLQDSKPIRLMQDQLYNAQYPEAKYLWCCLRDFVQKGSITFTGPILAFF